MKPSYLLAIVLVSGTSLMAQQTARPAAPMHPRILPMDLNDHTGWTQLFDGSTLNGWEGESKVWSVRDGAIVGEYDTPDGTRNGQTFLVLKDRKPGDFALKLEIKLEGQGYDSGIQYRSYIAPIGIPRPGAPPTPAHDPRFNLGGYQFDFNQTSCPPGGLAEGGRGGRGVIANRGQFVYTEAGSAPRVVAEMGTVDSLGAYFKEDDWNQIEIIARGHQITQIINGHVMAMMIDDDPAHFRAGGVIGLQAAGNGHQKISFRNIWLKELSPATPGR